MIPKKLKHQIFLRFLKRQVASGQLPGMKPAGTNPAKSFLILFNGTRPEDVEYFRKWHAKYEKAGIKAKMLAYVESTVDVHDFGMALYNKTGVDWKGLPKAKLVELVRSREFDILLNINPDELPHLHFLAVAARAKFKVSTLSSLPNDFNLTVKTKPGLSQQEIHAEITHCLETLSSKD